MCFSAPVSFTAGAVLLIVGTVTARRAARRTELPFALIPLLFGIQQLIEGALWLTFPAKAPVLNTVLTHVYSLFSHVLWPVYVPVSVLLIEPTPWRRKVLATIAVAGAAVALYLLYFLVRLPIVSQVTGRHIAYISPHFYAVASMAVYLLGTCVSLLFSSHLWVRVFGVAAFLSFISVYVFYANWFISVWCFFAALLSAIVLLHFRARGQGHGNRAGCATRPGVSSDRPRSRTKQKNAEHDKQRQGQPDEGLLGECTEEPAAGGRSQRLAEAGRRRQAAHRDAQRSR